MPKMTAQEILQKKAQAKSDNESPIPEYHAIYTKWEDKYGNVRIKISSVKLLELLAKLGYRRIDIGTNYFTIQLLNDSVIYERDETQVVDSVEDYLLGFGAATPTDGIEIDEIREKLFNGISTFFSKRLLNRLRTKDKLKIKNHDSRTAYFYYRNGYVSVTADKIDFKPYTEMDGVVWGNQILDRDFKYLDPEDYDRCNFAKFVKNISGSWKKRFYDDAKNENYDSRRYQKFKQMIGNGLHSFFEGKRKAVIFTDSRTDEEASGRSGKTLLLKAMGLMLNSNKYATTSVEIDGKELDMNDRFKFQSTAIDTRLLHLNDIKSNFDFERLFTAITEGLVCQQKNEKSFTINAKIYISTNRLLRIKGESAKDRSIEFEFSDYYKAGHGPDEEFNEWFFRDWDKHTWNQFDNFMIHCTQLFLRNGLEEVPPINLRLRKLYQFTAREFVEYMEEIGIKHNLQYVKKDLYENFIHKYPDFNSRRFTISRKKFSQWLDYYAEYHSDIDNIMTKRSNGRDYVTFAFTKEAIAEMQVEMNIN